MLDLNLIRIDGGTQSRAKLNNDVVTEYAEAYKAGAKFPAVTVYFDGKDRWLADGFHRYFAAKQAGKTSIHETIVPGTLREAKFHSWKANQEHGQRRTNEDKRNIVLEVLADEEAGKWSDNHIAKEFGFSPTFVGSLRKSLSTVDSEKPAERTFTNKHGTTSTMQTANIGKVAAPEIAPVVAKPVAVVEPETEATPDYTELDQAHEQISDLQAELVVARIASTDSEEQKQAAGLIAELRGQIKTLEAKLSVVTLSRDTFQNENAELRKQITRQRKEIDKATGKRTA